MLRKNIKPHSLLSTLWVFILFNMVFRDLHELLAPDYFEELLSLDISPQTMLFYGFILEIPILMVLLSRILGNYGNKWANLCAASIILLGMLSTLPSADLDDLFFTSVSSLALLIIIRVAWKLPTLKMEKSIL
ncbi:MAG: DUF6326 family protein [Bacteroidota bacterium]